MHQQIKINLNAITNVNISTHGGIPSWPSSGHNIISMWKLLSSKTMILCIMPISSPDSNYLLCWLYYLCEIKALISIRMNIYETLWGNYRHFHIECPLNKYLVEWLTTAKYLCKFIQCLFWMKIWLLIFDFWTSIIWINNVNIILMAWIHYWVLFTYFALSLLFIFYLLIEGMGRRKTWTTIPMMNEPANFIMFFIHR